jgi:hypothetical protein
MISKQAARPRTCTRPSDTSGWSKWFFRCLRPFKHPKTGVYWFCKAVPKVLQEALGKREEKRRLCTKDPVEAPGQLMRRRGGYRDVTIAAMALAPAKVPKQPE